MKTNNSIKTPITYYGGKQMMIRHLLPKIPNHDLYVEPFFGGGALYFAKEPSKSEVVNDINDRLIMFYKVLKYDFESLQDEVDNTFHSRSQYREADKTYKNQEELITSPVACAWSVWSQSMLCFSSRIGGSFGYDLKGSVAKRLYNKKEAFTYAFKERLKHTTIESYDALKVIKAYDSENSFFYIDPPYVSSNQGHYDGYTTEDFQKLLDVCATMKGKFLLSSYPEEILMEYRKKYGWESEDHIKTLAVSGKRKERKEKTECLTWNYSLQSFENQ